MLALLPGTAILWAHSSPAPDTPLGLAAHKGDVAVVRALVAAAADPNERDGNGDTPLAWAARGGHVLHPHTCTPQDAAHMDTVNALLAHGADARLPATPDGWSAERMTGHHIRPARQTS